MSKIKLTRKYIEKQRPDLIETDYNYLINNILDRTFPINHLSNFPFLLYNLDKDQINPNYKYKKELHEGVRDFKFDIRNFINNNFNGKGKIKSDFSVDNNLFSFYKFLHEKKKIPYTSLLSEV